LKKFEIEFKWALYFTAFNMLWLSLEKYLGWHDELIQFHIFYSLLIVFPQIILFYLALREKKLKYYEGNINWQQVFLSGGILSIIIAGLSPATIYYMNTFLSPDFIDLAVERYTMGGGKAVSAREFHSLEAYIKNAILFNVSIGIVISGILGIFMKTKSSDA
jgi:hypothetical protein